MSLRRTVATPFRQQGRDRMGESEFVVALSLDRDWFTPDQAKRLLDVAASEGLVTRSDGEVAVEFEADDVTVPDGFVPEESILQERSAFERLLDRIVDGGVEKQAAVATINKLQSELGITVEAAAVVYACRQGIDLGDEPERVVGEL